MYLLPIIFGAGLGTLACWARPERRKHAVVATIIFCAIFAAALVWAV